MITTKSVLKENKATQKTESVGHTWTEISYSLVLLHLLDFRSMSVHCRKLSKKVERNRQCAGFSVKAVEGNGKQVGADSMRMLDKNKQKLFYALQIGTKPIYETDDNGNIVYINVDGESIPVETGEKEIAYSEPVGFFANIATSGGESEAVAYGISTADYEATITLPKDLFPLEETSLIWKNTEPKHNPDGTINPKSADYTIAKISPSLNTVKYVLKEIVK